jgi:hypothetical protein
MAPFSVGEQVLVRQGDRGGQGAEVVASQPAGVYEVKMWDGSLLFYGGRQLKRVGHEVPAPAGARRPGVPFPLRGPILGSSNISLAFRVPRRITDFEDVG